MACSYRSRTARCVIPLVALAGCAARPPASRGPDTPGSTAGAAGTSNVPASASASSAAAGTRGVSSAESPALSESREPTAEEKARALPELEVEYVGLHVGGGPNDAAGKQPFERALGAQHEAFVRCYRQIEDPEHGGTFGVDLFVGRDGGHPSVRQVRTRLKGDAFSACMVSAFEAATFDKPRKGPTSISYSLRFGLKGLR